MDSQSAGLRTLAHAERGARPPLARGRAAPRPGPARHTAHPDTTGPGGAQAESAQAERECGYSSDQPHLRASSLEVSDDQVSMTEFALHFRTLDFFNR